MELKKLRKDYIAKHREIWNWLSENPDKEKMHWPGWSIYESVPNNCFLCGYADATAEMSCHNCPIDWRRTEHCMDREPVLSYYLLYDEATTLKDKTKYAEIIASLPEKNPSEGE